MWLWLEKRKDMRLKELNEKVKERQSHTNFAGEGLKCTVPLKTSESIARMIYLKMVKFRKKTE